MRQMDIPIPTPIRHLPELQLSSGDHPTYVIDLSTKMTRIFQSTLFLSVFLLYVFTGCANAQENPAEERDLTKTLTAETQAALSPRT